MPLLADRQADVDVRESIGRRGPGDVRGPGHVEVHHLAGDAEAAGEGGGVNEPFHEPHENVSGRYAELDQQRGLVRLDPGVDALGAFDGGGLQPALAAGGITSTAYLPGERFLKGSLPVGVGGGRAHCADGLAEGIEHLLAAGDTVTAAGVLQDHLEPGPALFLGRLGNC